MNLIWRQTCQFSQALGDFRIFIAGEKFGQFGVGIGLVKMSKNVKTNIYTVVRTKEEKRKSIKTFNYHSYCFFIEANIKTFQ